MKFSEFYSINEKFTHDFTVRDFGDGVPTIVPIPDGIDDIGRIESYAHSKDAVYTFIFDSNGDISHFVVGDFDDPAGGGVTTLDDPKKKYMAMQQHPSDPSAQSDYSGVEPLKPPFKGYTGPYHIPKEFNMTKFNPYGSFKGIRSPDNWDLN